MLPVPTVEYLAQFTGRAESTFTAFADEALLQATLLFSIVTNRTEFPDDEDLEALGIRAILEMADRIYLEQPWAANRATPFTSETIGSYSYAKSITAQKARDRQPTGLLWWDLAVDELSLADRSIVASGSVSNLERASIWTDTTDGQRYVIGPADTDTENTPLYVNAEIIPR